jgi:hypothetical protein
MSMVMHTVAFTACTARLAVTTHPATHSPSHAPTQPRGGMRPIRLHSLRAPQASPSPLIHPPTHPLMHLHTYEVGCDPCDCIHCVHRKPRRHHSSTHPLTLSCTYTTTRWDATHAIAFTACTTSLAVSPTNSPINPLKAATWADFLKCTSESSYCQGREMPAINIMDAWHFSDRRANAPPLLPEEYGYSYSC